MPPPGRSRSPWASRKGTGRRFAAARSATVIGRLLLSGLSGRARGVIMDRSAPTHGGPLPRLQPGPPGNQPGVLATYTTEGAKFTSLRPASPGPAVVLSDTAAP